MTQAAIAGSKAGARLGLLGVCLHTLSPESLHQFIHEEFVVVTRRTPTHTRSSLCPPNMPFREAWQVLLDDSLYPKP